MSEKSPEELLDKELAHLELRLLYDNATRNIEFTKRQSWWLTNQALIAFGALVFVESQFDRLAASALIIILMIAVIPLFVMLVNDLNRAAQGERDRIKYIISDKFTKEYNEAWSKKQGVESEKNRQISCIQVRMDYVVADRYCFRRLCNRDSDDIVCRL